MHRLCFLFVFLIGKFESFSQTNSGYSDEFPVAVNAEFYDLDLGKSNQRVSERFIRSIRVLDYRPDTGRIGVYQYGNKPITEELKLRKGLSAKLDEQLNKYLSNSNGNLDLVLVLRECWISNYAPLNRVVPKDPKLLRFGVNMMIQLKVDIFEKKQDLWCPYLRIDTIAYSSGTVYSWGKRKLNELIGDLAKRLTEPMINQRQGDCVSEESLHKYYKQSLEIPIYKEPKLKKGIYKNFDEFKRNAPSIEEYTIDSGSNYFMVLPKDKNGVANISRSVWGYCDGTGVYFQIQAMYFPTIRKGNALYVYCPTLPEKRTFHVPLVIPFLWAYAGDIQLDKKLLSVDGMALFRIDLQEGNIY